MKLVKLTELELALAKLGYRLEGHLASKAPKAPMSTAARKAISKGIKAAWATRKAQKPLK